MLPSMVHVAMQVCSTLDTSSVLHTMIHVAVYTEGTYAAYTYVYGLLHTKLSVLMYVLYVAAHFVVKVHMWYILSCIVNIEYYCLED